MRVEIEIIVPDENDNHQPAQIIEQYHLQQLPFEFGIAEGESGDHQEHITDQHSIQQDEFEREQFGQDVSMLGIHEFAWLVFSRLPGKARSIVCSVPVWPGRQDDFRSYPKSVLRECSYLFIDFCSIEAAEIILISGSDRRITYKLRARKLNKTE